MQYNLLHLVVIVATSVLYYKAVEKEHWKLINMLFYISMMGFINVILSKSSTGTETSLLLFSLIIISCVF